MSYSNILYYNIYVRSRHELFQFTSISTPIHIQHFTYMLCYTRGELEINLKRTQVTLTIPLIYTISLWLS